MSTLSDNIKTQRLALSMTQEQLGRQAGGRSVNQINGYERGRSRPSPPVLADIAKALRTTPDVLLGNVRDGQTVDRPIPALVEDLRKAVARALETSVQAVRISVDVQ